jgi:hypothetical protein
MSPADTPGHAEAEAARAELRIGEPRARVRSRRAVRASWLAFSLIAGAIVAGKGSASAWLLLVSVGLLGAILTLFDDLRWRVREVLPYRSVRRLLVITPESAGFRDAPRPLALHLDGQPLLLGAAPRLELTRSGGHSQVILVLADQVLVLDSLRFNEAAILRARELALALGLTPPASQPTGGPGVSEVREASLAVLTLITFASLLGVIDWLSRADLPDSLAVLLTLAAVIAGALVAAGRRLCLRVLRAEAMASTRFLHHLPTAAVGAQQDRSRRNDIGVLGALGSLVVGALVAVSRLGALELPVPTHNCFQPEGPHLCRSDEDGDGLPEVIGRTCKSGDWSLSAVEAKSGKLVQSRPFEHSEGTSYCESSLLRVESSPSEKKIDVTAWSPRFNTTRSNWRLTFRGKLVEVLQTDDCALLHIIKPDSQDVWQTLSIATGGGCPSIAEPVSLATLDAVRAAQDKRARGPEPGLQRLDGVTYALEKLGAASPRLVLSAWQGETLLWTTRLPARPLDELPLAIAAGTVIVGAADLRTGKYLRILGVDASTGNVRYVRRHPRAPRAPVDLVAAGGMVFVEAGRLAGFDAAAGQIAWITKETE